MQAIPLSIAGAYVLKSHRHTDHRGAFSRLFCDVSLREILQGRKIVQINYSYTAAAGALRGLHFQYPPHAETKIVRCLRGRVWDVLVDLREGSPTMLSWHAEELSKDNNQALLIPEGCAHGFQVLEPESELLYLHTVAYTPSAEGGLRFDDPRLAIDWPLPVTDVSARDRGFPLVESGFNGVRT